MQNCAPTGTSSPEQQTTGDAALERIATAFTGQRKQKRDDLKSAAFWFAGGAIATAGLGFAVPLTVLTITCVVAATALTFASGMVLAGDVVSALSLKKAAEQLGKPDFTQRLAHRETRLAQWAKRARWAARAGAVVFLAALAPTLAGAPAISALMLAGLAAITTGNVLRSAFHDGGKFVGKARAAVEDAARAEPVEPSASSVKEALSAAIAPKADFTAAAKLAPPAGERFSPPPAPSQKPPAPGPG